jgi:hypothetical protein
VNWCVLTVVAIGVGTSQISYADLDAVTGWEVHLNTGNTDNLWERKADWDIPYQGTYMCPSFCDLDNDGDYDAYVTKNNNPIIAFENIGSSTVPNWQRKTEWDFYVPGMGENSVYWIDFVDLDNDGKCDLTVAKHNTIKAYKNTGAALFAWTRESSWDVDMMGESNIGYSFGDLDGDGDYDVIARVWSTETIAFENIGSTSNPVWQEKPSWSFPFEIGLFALGDLDGDMDLDALGEGHWSGATAFENTGTVNNPTWTEKTSWGIYSGWFVSLVDIDGDGAEQTGLCTLQVADASGLPGSIANPVDVVLRDSMSVGGVQFTLRFDGSLLSADSAVATSRTSHMNMSCNTWTDSMKVLIFSAGGDSILTGTESVAKIFFSVDGSAVGGEKSLIRARNVAVSDPGGSPVTCAVFDGWFYFGGACTLQVADTIGSPGSSNNPLNIELSHSTPAGGVQFTLEFNGDLLSADSAIATSRTSHMNMSYNAWADSIKVLMFSVGGDSILAGTGSIAQVFFDIDQSAVPDDSSLVSVKSVAISNPQGSPISCIPFDGWIHFQGLKGDLNGDGTVDIVDLVRCVNIVLSRPPEPTPYELWAADMNDDVAVNVVDIVAIVNVILGRKNAPDALPERAPSLVSVGKITDLQDGWLRVPIEVTNSVPIAGVQVTVEYDVNTMTIGEAETTLRSDGFQIAYNATSGEITVVLYDASGSAINEGSGAIASVLVKSASLNIDTRQLRIKDVILVAENGSRVRVSIDDGSTATLVPRSFGLSSACPSPFHSETELFYQLPQRARVSLCVYNDAGQLVRTLADGHRKAGWHSARWDGRDADGKPVISAVYFCRMQAGSDVSKFNSTTKLILIH